MKGRDERFLGGMGLALGGAVKRGGHTQATGQGPGRLERGPCGKGKALVTGRVDI